MRKIFLLILILFGGNAMAKPSIVTGFVSPSSVKSLKLLLLEDAGLPAKLARNPNFLERVKKHNPHIGNFKKIQTYERVYLELPYGVKISRKKKAPLKKKTTPLITTGFVLPFATQDIQETLRNDARLPAHLVNDPEFIQLTKRMNPQIKDFQNIPNSEKVYLEIPYGTKLAKGTTFVEAPNITEMEYKPKKRTAKSDWTLSAFYTASRGVFNEAIDGIDAQSNQDSPITLGASTIFNTSPELFYSGSFYVSQLDPALVNNETRVVIPPEIGVTSYANWQKGWIFIPYAGLDYERFSTLNLAEMEEGEEPDVREHDFLYITGGMTKTFSLLNQTILFKGSVSQTLWSQSTGQTQFSGNKYILFFATKLVENWSAHFMYKQHFMTGPSDLDITRIGMGIGYTFF